MERAIDVQKVIELVRVAIRQNAHRAGNMLVDRAQDKMLEAGEYGKRVYDTGEMWNKAGYKVDENGKAFTLRTGSNVEHEAWVLGGKEPSWTPLAPIQAWVERKGLAWTDKKSGEPLSAEDIAWLVIRKIKAKGIKARPVFKESYADLLPEIEKVLFQVNINYEA